MQVELARVEAIFAEAVAKAAGAARAAYLAEACGGDAELRGRVEALLAAHEDVGSFLKLPTAGEATLPFVTLSERPGTKIGRFKLLEQIGEGGFGVVFMAEQEEPVRRLVALKIIKLGMDTRQVVARFEAERQALALMDHPNVARVLDGGATDTGRPYFVMELVKGTPITEYCDKNNLSIAQRLELFSQVCQAVQHAHQKGLIHRDIKPTNVLVTTQDDRPVAKVIDFGVAKAMQSRLTEKTLFTEFQQLVGTPTYMSPEQAEGSLDIDTRSDVYSLGVLLYELLAGSTPFDPTELRAKAFVEMQRMIREVEPPTPSTRLSSRQETLPTIAAHRSIEPRKLAPLLRGELDWIVMKCLEKDRRRRYESASALAADVMRYLADEPLQACAPSAAYRLRKFVRRNMAAMLTMALVAATLIMGTAVSTWQAIRASSAEEQAHKNEQKARANEQEALINAKQAEAVSNFLVKAFRSPDPQRDGRTVTIAEVLQRAVDELPVNFGEDSLTRSSLMSAIGQSYTGLGLYDESIPVFEETVRLFKTNYGGTHQATLESMNWLAIGYHNVGRRAEALPLFEQTLALCKEHLGPTHSTTLSAMNTLATAYRDAGRPAEAIGLYRETLRLQKEKLGPTHPDTLFSMNTLAIAYCDDVRTTDALPLLEEALRIQKEKFGPTHLDVLMSTHNLARAYMMAGRLAESVPLEEETLRICQQQLGPTHPDTLACMNLLASAYKHAKRLADAIQLYDQTLPLLKEKHGPTHPHTLITMHNLAGAYRDAGRWAEAVKLYEETLPLEEKHLSPTHPHTLNTRCQLANVYSRTGRIEQAIAICDEGIRLKPDDQNLHIKLAEILSTRPASDNRRTKRAVEIAGKATELSPGDFVAWRLLGLARYWAGDWNGSVEAIQMSISIRPKNEGGDSFDWFFLAMSHARLGHKKEAQKWYDDATAWMNEHMPENEDLLYFRAEATKLLGIAETKSAADPVQPPSTASQPRP